MDFTLETIYSILTLDFYVKKNSGDRIQTSEKEEKMKITRRNFLLFSGFSSASLFSKKHKAENDSRPSLKKPFISSSRDAWIELNLENMRRNLEKVRKKVKVPVMAVIKANAYGHGLKEVGRYLNKIDIDFLMVCKLQEAMELREAGVACPVHNFGPFSSEDANVLIKNNISQSVFTEEVQNLSQTAQKIGTTAKIHIHIDTGMGRMGIPYYKALPYIERVSSLKGIKIIGISTTLTEDDEFDREQLNRFHSLCRNAEKKGLSLGLKHAASSAGIFALKSSYLDLVRPGIVLYGYYPSEKTQKQDSLSLKPVLQLKSRVAAVKTLRRGDSIAYHRAYIAKKREKIAVIPTGYSDGYPFNVIDKGFVLIKGERFPIIGGITANHMEVRLKLDSPIAPGDETVLIGSQGKDKITANEVARWAEVSTYKILLCLNPLLPIIII